MTKSVAESFMEARDLILGDEGAREAAVYKYGARSMSTEDQNSKEYRFESFVGILLSPMVTDPINWRVVQRLKANLPGGLTAQSIKDATEDEIYRLMSDMNFNK
uniref:Uncharacterized protein n=1 Tax=Panagrolaimus sp. PS1159 TaxID=55785 RepID=A0AC35GNP8_9BILA